MKRRLHCRLPSRKRETYYQECSWKFTGRSCKKMCWEVVKSTFQHHFILSAPFCTFSAESPGSRQEITSPSFSSSQITSSLTSSALQTVCIRMHTAPLPDSLDALGGESCVIDQRILRVSGCDVFLRGRYSGCAPGTHHWPRGRLPAHRIRCAYQQFHPLCLCLACDKYPVPGVFAELIFKDKQIRPIKPEPGNKSPDS